MDDDRKLALAIEAVRDQLIAVVRDHEITVHGGDECWGSRANAVAFLAHSLSVRGEVWKYALQCRREYDAGCHGEAGGFQS